MKKKILVLGAAGQIGTDLTLDLRNMFGAENVIASDLKIACKEVMEGGVFEIVDVLNKQKLSDIIDRHQINEIYHLAAILSARAEQNPMFSWDVNMKGLFNVLELAREKKLGKIFWPSSIAVFGPTTPKQNTPQDTIMDPNTVYGISKLAGERWIEYYNDKYNVDVRSVRYPGLISYKTAPGGGTTDYAVEIFYDAIKHGKYECFLKEDAYLPMMFMPDAIKVTIELMQVDRKDLKLHTSYNVASMSFSPKEIAEEIKKYVPDFEITYKPDYRQEIAESWPQSIDDSVARSGGGWKHDYDLSKMTEIMIREIKKKLEQEKQI